MKPDIQPSVHPSVECGCPICDDKFRNGLQEYDLVRWSKQIAEEVEIRRRTEMERDHDLALMQEAMRRRANAEWATMQQFMPASVLHQQMKQQQMMAVPVTSLPQVCVTSLPCNMQEWLFLGEEKK